MTQYPPVVIGGILLALLVAAGLVAALTITGHPEALSSPSVLVVLGFCATTITTLLGIGAVHGQVVEVHQQVNSRLDELVAAKSLAAHGLGFAEGQASNTPPTP